MRIDERILRRVLIAIPLVGLGAGLAAWFSDHSDLAQWAFGLGTAPVIASLAISIIRDLLAGRMGVDAVAFLSMAAALALGENFGGGDCRHHVCRRQSAGRLSPSDARNAI